MKIIAPYQITSEILNLINEANEYLIIVSPYVNFKNWERIKTDLKNALDRNIKINFYTRLDSENFKSWEEIESLGIKPKLIKNLHAKLYFNESSGIVTSMNLLTSSNLNAIEFGCLYDQTEELSELKKFVKKFLEPNLEKEKPNQEELYIAKEKFNIILSNFLSQNLNQSIKCWWKDGFLNLNANNSYFLGIDKVNNILTISGIISGLESEKFNEFITKAEKNLKPYKICKSDPGNRYLSSAILTSNKEFSSSNFNFLNVNEKMEILDISLKFIKELSEFKNDCYKNKKASC